MTQDQVNKVLSEYSEYEKEISDHNEQLLKSLGEDAQKYFKELMDCCSITEKIKLVDAPKGTKQDEDCGIYKDVHVDQWCTNMEGDSFSGFIYANVNGQWIEVPFNC